MKSWLKKEWFNLAFQYSDNANSIDKLWKEIEKRYEHKSRHYHNFTHIYEMLIQLEASLFEINDNHVLKFAIWYHDVIYKSTKKDNEEKSADFAKTQLKYFNFKEKRMKNIQNLIISTKKHELILHNNIDNAILLDLDLSILGADWKTYEKYIKQIRKEYAIYPNFMYRRGRKQVLQHFLEREKLYFTKEYQINLEHQARKNLKKEIELL